MRNRLANLRQSTSVLATALLVGTWSAAVHAQLNAQTGSSAPGSPDYQPSRAPAAVVAPPRPSVREKTCDEVLAGVMEASNDEAASARLTPDQNFQSLLWAAQVYVRVINKHPSCDAKYRQLMLEQLRSSQEFCRTFASPLPAASRDCQVGRNYLGTTARTEAAIRDLFPESPVAEGSPAVARAGSLSNFASGRSERASSIPGSADYQPPRRPAIAPQADDPKVPGASYRP